MDPGLEGSQFQRSELFVKALVSNVCDPVGSNENGKSGHTSGFKLAHLCCYHTENLLGTSELLNVGMYVSHSQRVQSEVTTSTDPLPTQMLAYRIPKQEG